MTNTAPTLVKNYAANGDGIIGPLSDGLMAAIAAVQAGYTVEGHTADHIVQMPSTLEAVGARQVWIYDEAKALLVWTLPSDEDPKGGYQASESEDGAWIVDMAAEGGWVFYPRDGFLLNGGEPYSRAYATACEAMDAAEAWGAVLAERGQAWHETESPRRWARRHGLPLG